MKRRLGLLLIPTLILPLFLAQPAAASSVSIVEISSNSA